MRHGEIPQREPRRFVGQTDLPLTEHGRRQAARWAEAVGGQPLAGAWCSDLSRCVDTARLVLARNAVSARPLRALREVDLGQWEGLTEEELRQRFPGEHERRGADLANVAPAGGESFAQVQDRAWRALQDIVADAKGLVLAVAHAGVNRALLCRILGLPLDRLFSLGQDYCAMNIIDFAAGRPPQLRALNLPPMGPGQLRDLLAPDITIWPKTRP
jgi:probable phosphoglycerate mutase